MIEKFPTYLLNLVYIINFDNCFGKLLNRNQKRITPWNIQLDFLTLLFSGSFFEIINHICNHIINQNQYFEFISWVGILNIWINISPIAWILNKKYSSPTLLVSLIKTWYCNLYRSCAHMHISSKADWWLIELNVPKHQWYVFYKDGWEFVVFLHCSLWYFL